MESKKILGLITARGGSKGVPRKNISVLGGRPLIAWTAEAALNSKLLDRVTVSTDDAEIAAVAAEHGLEVPFMRPAQLAQDDTPHVLVVLDAIQRMQKLYDFNPTHIVLLQPTSPFRSCEDIDNAIDLAMSKDAKAVVSVCETTDQIVDLISMHPPPSELHAAKHIHPPTKYISEHDKLLADQLK